MPLRRLLVMDMLLVGTFVNAAVGMAALILLSRGMPAGVGFAVFFSTLPYNLFLFAAVWKCSRLFPWARLCAAVWLAGCTLI